MPRAMEFRTLAVSDTTLMVFAVEVTRLGWREGNFIKAVPSSSHGFPGGNLELSYVSTRSVRNQKI